MKVWILGFLISFAFQGCTIDQHSPSPELPDGFWPEPLSPVEQCIDLSGYYIIEGQEENMVIGEPMGIDGNIYFPPGYESRPNNHLRISQQGCDRIWMEFVGRFGRKITLFITTGKQGLKWNAEKRLFYYLPIDKQHDGQALGRTRLIEGFVSLGLGADGSLFSEYKEHSQIRFLVITTDYRNHIYYKFCRANYEAQ